MREAPKDMITNLPEDILHRIHSFLEIKDGARTSVLSTRWYYIWKTVPILQFTNWAYQYKRLTDEMKEFKDGTRQRRIDNFMDFVDGTLHRRNSSNVDKFTLVCYHQLKESRVHSWISALIRGNVKRLSLQLYKKPSLCIPIPLFTCGSLTSLELTITHDKYTFPKVISFPKLKHLTLERLTFSDEYWNEEIFSNSPLLEELVLKCCEFRMANFCISIPTLKLLEFESYNRDYALKIHAPSLVKFTYYGYAAKEYEFSSFLSMVEAVVDFASYIDGPQICSVLQALAHVRCLTVGDHTLQALCSMHDLVSNKLLVFHNVKVLKLAEGITADEGLIAMLRAVPNLESVVFEKFFWDEEEYDDDDNDDTEGNGDDDSDSESVEGENSHNNEDEVEISNVAKCDKNDEEETDDDDPEGTGDDDSDAESVEPENSHNIEHEVDNSAVAKRDNSDVEEGSNEDDDGDPEGNGDDVSNAESVEGESSYDNEDEVDISDVVKCDSNDEGDSNYDNEDSWGLDIPHLKSVCFQEFVGNPREVRWVKLILKNVKSLQIMTFRHYACGLRFVNNNATYTVTFTAIVTA